MGWRGQASEHDADHSEPDPGGDRSAIAFEVAGEAPVSADPGEGTLDDPSVWAGQRSDERRCTRSRSALDMGTPFRSRAPRLACPRSAREAALRWNGSRPGERFVRDHPTGPLMGRPLTATHFGGRFWGNLVPQL